MMLCLLSSRACALTDEQKLVAIEIAKNKYLQLSEVDKLQAFQYLCLKFWEHEEEIVALKKKIEELEAKNKNN